MGNYEAIIELLGGDNLPISSVERIIEKHGLKYSYKFPFLFVYGKNDIFGWYKERYHKYFSLCNGELRVMLSMRLVAHRYTEIYRG